MRLRQLFCQSLAKASLRRVGVSLQSCLIVLADAAVLAGERLQEVQTFLLTKFSACRFQVGVLGTKLITASRGTDVLWCVHGILTIIINK